MSNKLYYSQVDYSTWTVDPVTAIDIPEELRDLVKAEWYESVQRGIPLSYLVDGVNEAT